MRTHVVDLLMVGIWLLCSVGQAAESGEVLVTTVEKGAPLIQTSTNDLYRAKLLGGLDKRTPDVKPEKPKEWRKMYDLFSAALVQGAKESGLQADSLEKLLKRLPRAAENRGIATIPVAAHQTVENGEPVWVITLKWEAEAEVKKGSAMEHIRYFSFLQKSLKQTGFVTCG